MLQQILMKLIFFLDSFYRLSWKGVFLLYRRNYKEKPHGKTMIEKSIVMNQKKFPYHYFLTKLFLGYYTSEFSDHRCPDILQRYTLLVCLKINLSIFYIILVISTLPMLLNSNSHHG